MAKTPRYPTARWFRGLGRCVSCGKPATGDLMSFRNDRIGTFCTRCGEREANAALKAVEETRKPLHV
ncbi:hypothetical protein [Methylobacterium sp. 1973]|uniref:hypothetical protein n=1 Tax=Methylobacterium sp. 1973 TaxID=3156421 RepID=UPI003397E51F